MICTNLEQRTADTYIKHFPPFVPDKQAAIEVSEQEQFYVIMKNLYQLAFDEPLLFATSLHEYDSTDYLNKEKHNENKIHMRKFV